MASEYWIRSLVPMEKKSTCSASRSAMATAEGTSIMIPTFILASKGCPRARSSCLTSSSTSLACSSSPTPEMRGNITRT